MKRRQFLRGLCGAVAGAVVLSTGVAEAKPKPKPKPEPGPHDFTREKWDAALETFKMQAKQPSRYQMIVHPDALADLKADLKAQLEADGIEGVEVFTWSRCA